MITKPRPELQQPVADFARRLAGGARAIPLVDLAALFGAEGALLDVVRSRGDIALTEAGFTNDGPELTVPAASVEIEIPMLMRGSYTLSDGGFVLTFPMPEFAPRACAQIAIVRKCFELKEMRATPDALELDFGNEVVDRRYTF